MAKEIAIEANESTSKIVDAIMGFVGDIPESSLKKSANPARDSKKLAKAASLKASVTAGALALPPGPLGWLTIIPELLAIWKIQAQLVADIAAIHGRKSELTQEQMIYCLFRHTAAQVMRDLVVRVGERVLVKRASLRVMKSILEKVGIKITQRTIGKGLARWVPLAGAMGVAGYAYYDTNQVGKTSADLFSSPIEVEAAAA